MLRIIVRTDDANMAANVGGSVETKFKTFDIDAPEVEAFVLALKSGPNNLAHRFITGVEIVPPAPAAE